MDYKYTIYKRTLFPPQIRHTGQEWGQTPVQASPEPQEPREPPRDQQRGMMWVKTNQKNYHNQCDPFAGVIAKRNTGQMTMWVMEPEALLLLNFCSNIQISCLNKYLDRQSCCDVVIEYNVLSSDLFCIFTITSRYDYKYTDGLI